MSTTRRPLKTGEKVAAGLGAGFFSVLSIAWIADVDAYASPRLAEHNQTELARDRVCAAFLRQRQHPDSTTLSMSMTGRVLDDCGVTLPPNASRDAIYNSVPAGQRLPSLEAVQEDIVKTRYELEHKGEIEAVSTTVPIVLLGAVMASGAAIYYSVATRES